MYKRTSTGWMKHLDFLICDLVCLHISFLISYRLRMGVLNPYKSEDYRALAVMLTLCFLAVVSFDRSYSGVLRRGYWKEMGAVLRSQTILFLLAAAYLFICHSGGVYSRIQLVSCLCLNACISYAAHLVLKKVLRVRNKNAQNQEYMLLVTKSSRLDSRLRQLTNAPFSNVKLSGIALLDEDRLGETVRDIPVVAYTPEQILEYAKGNLIDSVLFDTMDGQVQEIANVLLDMGAAVHLTIDRMFDYMPNPYMEKIGGIRVVTTSRSYIMPVQAFLKRALDICGGLVGLLLTGIAYLFVAPRIRKEAPGPVFFAQKRVGKNGRIFTIYKFRSMYMDAEERKQELMKQNKMQGLMFKMDDDPRIFPFGHKLRNSSIDELPQFWNILKGDMSLVGTRPPTLDEYKQYDFHHKSRLSAKPGLTGLWQVSGRSDITDFEEVVRLDNEYIQNWSLALDIKIILQTLVVVLEKKGSV